MVSRMRKPWLLIFFVLGINGAGAVSFNDDFTAFGDYVVNENVIIPSGVIFEANNLVVTDEIEVFNSGEMHGGISVCANCMMRLHNMGNFEATVYLQSGARLVQVIDTAESVTNLGMTGGYDVSVTGENGLLLRDVMAMTSGADTVEITNTRFDAGRVSDFLAPSNVALYGDIILYFEDVPDGEMLLFSNVSGDGAVHSTSSTLDALHVLTTYRVDNNVFMRINRSTDYARILNNDMGRFLNSMRENGIDGKLLAKLDSAQSMADINGILTRSVRTNPHRLLEPIKLFYRQKTSETMHIDDFTIFGVEPLLIRSSDVSIIGVRPNVQFNLVDNLHMNLSAYILNIDYQDDINDFRGMSYGIGVDAQYDVSRVDFVRAYAVANQSFFDVGPVFHNGHIINNPDGATLYLGGEYAHMFKVSGNYTLTPFVMAGAEYMNIVNSENLDTFVGAGADFGYKYEFDGLRYDYALRTFGRTDGAIGVGANISVWSSFDEAGANMHIGTIYDNDFGISYMLSINGVFRF